MAVHELLDGDFGALPQAEAGEQGRELRLIFDAIRARCAGPGARLHDERITDPPTETGDLLRVASTHGLGGRDPRIAKGLLHRRLVAAQVRGPHRRPGEPGGFPHAGDRKDVRFDRSLEAIHGPPPMDLVHGVREGALVAHGADLLVAGEPPVQVGAERLERGFAHRGHLGADFVQTAHEVLLVSGKQGFDEHDVHCFANNSGEKLHFEGPT